MQGEEFTSILSKLRASDEEAWQSICSHMDIIVRRWARREKIELDWVVSEDGIGNTARIIRDIFSRFRMGFQSGELNVVSYSGYKEEVFTCCQIILEDQYAKFHQMILERKDSAWQKVYERLYIYAAKWLSERNLEGEAAKVVYQESILTLFEKLKSEALSFKTSRDFKSYYFKILEFKYLESNRKRILHNRRWTEMHPGHLLKSIQEDPFEADDRYFRIEKIMLNSISKEEAFILKQYYFNKEKITEIAKALGISDGNCRQKKLQTLRKIAALYHQNEKDMQIVRTDKKRDQ